MPSSPLRAITHSLTTIASHQLIQVLGSAAFVLLVPRTLGAGLFGQLAVAFAFGTLWHTLGELGYQEIFARYVPEVRAYAGTAGVQVLAHRLLGVRGWLGLALGLLALGTAPWAAAWFTLEHRALIGLGVTLRVWAMGDFALLLGAGATARWVRETSWRQLILTGLIFLLNRPAILTLSLLALTLHEAVFWALGRLWVVRSEELKIKSEQLVMNRQLSPVSNLQSPIPNPPSPIPNYPLNTLLRFGLLFAAANFALALLFRLGPLLVAKLGGDSAEVGFFDLASSAWLLVYVALGQVALALVPILTELHLAGEVDALKWWLGRWVRYATGIAALAMGGIWAIAPTALPLAFGPAFAPAALAFDHIALGLLPLPLAWAGVVHTAVEKYPTRKLAATLVGLGLFLGLGAIQPGTAANLALAFSGSMVGYALGFGRTTLTLWRTVGFSWLKAVFASVIFLPLWLWPIPHLGLALAAWAACSVLYIGLLFGLGVGQWGEVQRLWGKTLGIRN